MGNVVAIAEDDCRPGFHSPLMVWTAPPRRHQSAKGGRWSATKEEDRP
jgi:hypothetical protein